MRNSELTRDGNESMKTQSKSAKMEQVTNNLKLDEDIYS
jgi:hypothetical protein